MSKEIWDWGASHFRRSDINRGSIVDTIRNWHQYPLQNEIIKRFWILFPRFVTWNIWKERNLGIFSQEILPTLKVCQLIKANLLETVQLQHWTKEDLNGHPSESLLLKN